MIESHRLTGIADEGAGTITEQIALHQSFGWKSIELRTVGGENVCEMDDTSFNALAAALEEADFTVVAFASGIANWSRSVLDDFERDLADLRRAAPRMHRLGAPFIRIMSYISGDADEAAWAKESLRRIRELVRIAAGEGVVLLLENCDGWASETPGNFARLLQEIPDSALCVVFDPGNPLAHGQEPEKVWQFYKAAKERIAHFHIKDCYRNSRGEIVHCFMGDGQCEVLPIIQDLEQSGYRGCYSIEPHITVQIHKGDVEKEGFNGMAESYREYARRAMKLLLTSRAPLIA